MLCALCVLSSKKTLIKCRPKTPSPLAGEGGGEGEKKKIIQFQYLTTPTPPSPVEGEGKMRLQGILFMVYGAKRGIKKCGEIFRHF
jgi:hypothetical protein